ncbi:MAG: c-type cytochrome biogenesis protein CcmI [Betaproteobacteria bacterium]|nr:c-type cytochrome biogenesis protein CcmI [Betaproteobacteria bacterium]
MIIFTAAAALMLAAALVLALFVFIFPRPPATTNSGRAENIAAARARLSDLRARRGELPDADAAEYETEIKKRLLDEAGLPDIAPPAFRPDADKTGIAVVFAAIVPGALALYLYLGAPFAAIAPHPDLSDKIGGLRQYIAQNPEDPDALALMGRIMAAMGRDEEAADFFSRAVRAAKKNKPGDKETR